MAVEVLWDGYVSINAVDQSDHCKGIQLPMSIEELDASVMGVSTMVNEPGAKSFGATISFLNDYTDDQLDEQLWDIWDQRSKVAIAIRKSQTDAISAANPEYQFTGFIAQLDVGADYGQLVASEVTLSNTTVLTRDITP